MPNYLIRFDRGQSERFEAVSDAAARDYVRELLYDEGAEPAECYPPGYPGPCPDGMDWSAWLAFNNVD